MPLSKVAVYCTPIETFISGACGNFHSPFMLTSTPVLNTARPLPAGTAPAKTSQMLNTPLDARLPSLEILRDHEDPGCVHSGDECVGRAEAGWLRTISTVADILDDDGIRIAATGSRGLEKNWSPATSALR